MAVALPCLASVLRPVEVFCVDVHMLEDLLVLVGLPLSFRDRPLTSALVSQPLLGGNTRSHMRSLPVDGLPDSSCSSFDDG